MNITLTSTVLITANTPALHVVYKNFSGQMTLIRFPVIKINSSLHVLKAGFMILRSNCTWPLWTTVPIIPSNSVMYYRSLNDTFVPPPLN